jgi:hypothetical protein
MEPGNPVRDSLTSQARQGEDLRTVLRAAVTEQRLQSRRVGPDVSAMNGDQSSETVSRVVVGLTRHRDICDDESRSRDNPESAMIDR